MRFTTLFSAGLLAVASAQSTSTSSLAPATTATPTTINTVAAAQSSQQAAINACLKACKAGDVACQSKCIEVPNPSTANINDTNKCIADCPKGNGTKADNDSYATCQQGCISKYYYTGTPGVPASQPTAGSGSGSGSGTGSGSGSGSGGSGGSGSGSGGSPSGTVGAGASGSGTGAGASQTGANGAGRLYMAGSAVGLVGFVAALLAL